MTTIADRVRRTRTHPGPESLRAAQDVLSRVTGLRLDLRSLEPGEARRIVELVDAARPPGSGGLNLGQLDRRQQRDLDGLLEQGAGLPAGALKQRRDEQNAASRMQELARRATRRPITRRQEEGLLAEIWKQVSEHRALQLPHLGALTYVLAAFAAGDTLGPGSRFERNADGDPVLYFNARFGLFGHASGTAGNDLKALKQLEKNAWITLDRRGTQVTVGLGARTKRLLREAT